MISATRRQNIPGDRVRRRRPCSNLNAGCRRANIAHIPVICHAPLRLSQPASLCRCSARGGDDGRARQRPGALSRRRLAPQIRRARPRLQRPGRGVECDDRGAQARREPRCRRKGPGADGGGGSALSVRAAQGRAARLHGAEGGRDGRLAAAAGAHPARPGDARQSRAHARQYHRGRGAVRDTLAAGDLPAARARASPRGMGPGAPPGVLR